MIYKKLTSGITVFAFIFALAITGCDSDSFSDGDADLETNIDSVSYAFGYLNGQQMVQREMSDLDPEIFAEAMEQAFEEDSSIIPERELSTILQSYQRRAQQKTQQMKQQEAKENEEKGQAFLEENKTKEGVQTTESGLQYKIVKEGSGASPGAEDTVVVNYEGSLLDGEVFDSSYDRGQPAEIPLNRVIPGWTEGIQLMEKGAEYTFWIPGNLAYGLNPRANGPIGPNETLVFDVELVEVK